MKLAPVNIKNKRATFDYELIDTYTAGIVLTGTEIKSIRMGKASLVDTFCYFAKGELWVKNMHIAEYFYGSYNNHTARRDRKLLLNKKELKKDVYVMENTAENDMLLFFNFLNSPYAVRYCNEHDIAIVLNNSVQDLTGIINDTEYEFRAMLEFEVRFTQLAVGDTGTLSPDNIKKDNEGNTIITPDKSDTGSSGGNDGLKDNEGEYFTNVRINKKLMKEEK